MPESDGIEKILGLKPASAVFTYTPEPPRCICGATLSITGGLSDAKIPNLTVTITHPEPVCGDFGPMLRRSYFPPE